MKAKLKKNEFYCLHCHKRVTGDDRYMRNVKNKKVGTVKMMKGYCHKCSGKVNKFVKKGTTI